ncbi:MAG: hypothetical protein IJL71_02690 [Oscillospiraceae bacterium]|nr:hypothetical protein [Oscillospiraceae bacterium]
MKLKKILSMLLAFCMVLGIAPSVVLAESSLSTRRKPTAPLFTASLSKAV